MNRNYKDGDFEKDACCCMNFNYPAGAVETSASATALISPNQYQINMKGYLLQESDQADLP